MICVTPTKNEAWIINPFLAAAGCWADHTIVADQGSTDGTPDAVLKAPKAQLVRNESTVFDENHRQKLLLESARKIPGPRILIGLDADEALSANCRTSPDWARIAAAKPGTILRFRWANIMPGFTTAWVQPAFIPFGFVDDGSPHEGKTIHSPRVPQPAGAPTLDLHDIVVLHFQYVLWDRMRSKQRWYQAWEHLKHGRKSPLDIFREYNHMHGSWGKDEIQPVPPEWLAGYATAGIRFDALRCEPVTWWDRELVQIITREGGHRLRRLAIWDKDWRATGRQLGVDTPALEDPRSPWEKGVHRLLAATQERRANPLVRVLEKFLRATGW
jgi:hypothetical protein